MRALQEVRQEQEQIINRNFLEDDQQWDLCCEDFKLFKDI